MAGGEQNLASGSVSTIGGGYYNGASGFGATIPGGYANAATGSNSLAAGYLRFNGSGYPRMKSGAIANQSIILKNTQTLRSSTIFIDVAGRVRSCTTGSTGC